MGIKGLRKLQLGRETVEGTSVAATAVWRGLGTIEDQREVAWVDEDVGYVSGLDRTITPKLLGGVAFESVPCTFEQFGYVLNAGVEYVASGVADGAGSGKIYTHDFPTNALNTINPYTVEGGDDQEGEELNGAFVESFDLNGAGGEALMLAANWLGRTVAVAAMTGALAIPTVEDMLFGNSKLYIDLVGGAFGATQVSQTFLGMALKVTTGWKFKYSGDGALYPTIRYFDKNAFEVLCDITFEHDATGAARKVDWRAETAKRFQIKCEGSNLAASGTTYSKKTLLVNFVGKIEKVTKIDEQDGNDIVTATLRGRYNATAATMGQIIVVNELASLP